MWKKFYFRGKKLVNLPDILTRSTDFQCILFLCCTKWKRILSTVAFELEYITQEEANFLKININSDLGKVSYDAMQAGDILSYKTSLSPLLGDFKLKYEETEKVFAPLIIKKTFTSVSPSQNIQSTLQPQTMQLSPSSEKHVGLYMSRVNFEEIKLQQKAVGTDKDSLSEYSVNQNGKQAECNSQLNLSNQASEANYDDVIDTVFNDKKSTESKFRDLLSNAGLSQIANNISINEWNVFACMLDVPFCEQERLLRENPYNSQKQIVDMLRWWRNHQNDDESVIKGKLCDALSHIGKSEIVEQLMKARLSEK